MLRKYLPWATPFAAATFGVLALLPNDLDEPFGVRTVAAPTSWITTGWARLKSDMAADAIIVARCRTDPETCTAAALQFIAIVDDALGEQRQSRIGHINRAVNLAITSAFREGPLIWKSPLAVLADGRSDCNGYAIVKYAALDAAQASEHRMLIVRMPPPINRDHMIVVQRDMARWLILDDQTFALIDTVDSRYVPLFELADRGVRQFVQPEPTVAGLPCGGPAVAALP